MKVEFDLPINEQALPLSVSENEFNLICEQLNGKLLLNEPEMGYKTTVYNSLEFANYTNWNVDKEEFIEKFANILTERDCKNIIACANNYWNVKMKKEERNVLNSKWFNK